MVLEVVGVNMLVFIPGTGRLWQLAFPGSWCHVALHQLMHSTVLTQLGPECIPPKERCSVVDHPFLHKAITVKFWYTPLTMTQFCCPVEMNQSSWRFCPQL
ncbi:hypothetical protein E2C01_007753 [Portunus trituberculatus]|uniref:Uncharacterized protein n=1 Tax=Portunus trituberculatus TaxID=210409 RepID=A0A5B7D4R8_PORTR|nr:hypothetical protein [Portunus trituberculatus]